MRSFAWSTTMLSQNVEGSEALLLKWDRSWPSQIESFFETQCVWIPLGNADPESKAWYDKWQELGGLIEATRSVRHVPNYAPQPDGNGRYPVKCSLLGTFEQIGPGTTSESLKFWTQLASPNWEGIGGTRRQKNGRLCAVSLTKRFAWPLVLCKKLKLGDPRKLRYLDTATVAARRWLGDDIDPEKIRNEKAPDTGKLNDWSGQWLHWTRRDPEGEEPCPKGVWDLLKEKKRKATKPPPPKIPTPVATAANMVEVTLLERMEKSGPNSFRVQEEGKNKGMLSHGKAPDPLPEVGAVVTVYRVPTSSAMSPQYRWSPPEPPKPKAQRGRGRY